MLIVSNKYNSLKSIFNYNSINERYMFEAAQYMSQAEIIRALENKKVTKVLNDLYAPDYTTEDGNKPYDSNKNANFFFKSTTSGRNILQIKSSGEYKGGIDNIKKALDSDGISIANRLSKDVPVEGEYIVTITNVGNFKLRYSGANNADKGFDKISTAQQEGVTSALFEHIINNGWENPYTTKDSILGDNGNKEAITLLRNGDKQLNPSDAWVTSWIGQCKALCDNKSSIPLKNVKKSCVVVSKEHVFADSTFKSMIGKLTSVGKVKDNIDSSDIYIAKSKDIGSIISSNKIFKKSSLTSNDILNGFHDLFISGKLVGISLKQVKGVNKGVVVYPKQSEMAVSITNIEYAKVKHKSGYYWFKWLLSIITSGGDIKKYTLKLRYNGTTTRLDIAAGNSQTIGDVAASMWNEPSNSDSLQHIVKIKDKISIGMEGNEDLVKAFDGVTNWNTKKIKSTFMNYFNNATKVTDHHLDHLLIM